MHIFAIHIPLESVVAHCPVDIEDVVHLQRNLTAFSASGAAGAT